MGGSGQKSSSFDTLLREGTRLLRSGRAQSAIPLLEQAHGIDPDHLDAALNLSGAYILSGKFKQAVPLLQKLVESEPENAMLWTNLGAAYLGNPVIARDQEQERAIAAFKKALELVPTAPSVAYNIGLIYRDRRELDLAIHWFETAIQSNPKDRDARRILKQLRRARAEK